jgi:alkylation response protein AidB-like acyl-CoA dehydrogenase
MERTAEKIEPFDGFLEPLLLARQPRIKPYLSRLTEFHDWVLTEVDAQANYTDRYAPPALQPYDRHGEIANRVVVNPWYENQHQEAYRRGIIGLPYQESAPNLLSFAMGYLLSQADASLHCPVTLTGAVACVLGCHADAKLRSKYLHEMTRMDGKTKTGGTWATEKQGGSDIGATTTMAVAKGNGFALRGLKWFTSNANSSLAVATARPQGAESGSKGLGLYLVPSHLEDGSPNHYRIRRLKDKLGTRGLPTGEIELMDAEAVELAPPPRGFKLMMEALEYSRIHNAVGAAGMQRRSLREALQWAQSREAFGHKLIDFPMVLDELLGLRVRFEASTLLAFEAALAFDASLHDPQRKTWLRFLTALAKYLTAEDAIRAARAALELIGGNGYTSDYPMARILRDAQVLTVWEGPANIQALELMRLLLSYNAAAEYEGRVGEIMEGLPQTSPLASKLIGRLAEDRSAIEFVTTDEARRELYARKLLHRLSQSLAFALMCELAGKKKESERYVLAAIRYYEEIEPSRIGGENQQVRTWAAELLRD